MARAARRKRARLPWSARFLPRGKAPPRIFRASVPRAPRCAMSWHSCKSLASSAWWRCAATCPAATASAASSNTPATWWPSSAKKLATTSTSKWRLTPKSTRKPSRPRLICKPLLPKCAPVPTRPSRSIFSMPTLTFALSMTRSAWGWRCPSCRASCRFWVRRS